MTANCFLATLQDGFVSAYHVHIRWTASNIAMVSEREFPHDGAKCWWPSDTCHWAVEVWYQSPIPTCGGRVTKFCWLSSLYASRLKKDGGGLNWESFSLSFTTICTKSDGSASLGTSPSPARTSSSAVMPARDLKTSFLLWNPDSFSGAGSFPRSLFITPAASRPPADVDHGRPLTWTPEIAYSIYMYLHKDSNSESKNFYRTWNPLRK